MHYAYIINCSCVVEFVHFKLKVRFNSPIISIWLCKYDYTVTNFIYFCIQPKISVYFCFEQMIICFRVPPHSSQLKPQHGIMTHEIDKLWILNPTFCVPDYIASTCATADLNCVKNTLHTYPRSRVVIVYWALVEGILLKDDLYTTSSQWRQWQYSTIQ